MDQVIRCAKCMVRICVNMDEDKSREKLGKNEEKSREKRNGEAEKDESQEKKEKKKKREKSFLTLGQCVVPIFLVLWLKT